MQVEVKRSAWSLEVAVVSLGSGTSPARRLTISDVANVLIGFPKSTAIEAVMASQEYVKLAQSLPPRLLRFFARYPPPPQSLTNRATTSSISTTSNTSSADPNADLSETPIPDEPSTPPYQNPFQPHKHPITGRWHDPVYSLRRQADLVKMARENGVEELLPYTKKGTEVRLLRRQEQGLKVKGTGVGQRVKGKIWERTMKGRLEKRRQAMLEMPKMVQQWKQVSRLRGSDSGICADCLIVGSWTRVEEMAKMIALVCGKHEDHSIARMALYIYISNTQYSICVIISSNIKCSEFLWHTHPQLKNRCLKQKCVNVASGFTIISLSTSRLINMMLT